MYRIAICEDEKTFLDENAKICAGIMEKLDAEYETFLFESSAALLDAFFARNRRYDLLLLDIVMDETCGMKLAQKIREHDADSVIIFITAHTEYAIDGYGVGALHYLVKPICPDRLERLIAADYHRRFTQNHLVFRSGVQNYRIVTKDVVYLEIMGRSVNIVLMDGSSVQYQGKLSDFLSGLRQFVRCHNSFAVNIANIREIERTCAIAVNGREIPVSRTYFKETQKAFLRQMRKLS